MSWLNSYFGFVLCSGSRKWNSLHWDCPWRGQRNLGRDQSAELWQSDQKMVQGAISPDFLQAEFLLQNLEIDLWRADVASSFTPSNLFHFFSTIPNFSCSPNWCYQLQLQVTTGEWSDSVHATANPMSIAMNMIKRSGMLLISKQAKIFIILLLINDIYHIEISYRNSSVSIKI